MEGKFKYNESDAQSSNFPVNTQRCFNVEIWLILRRDVAQPKHNVVSTLVFQRQIRNVETTLGKIFFFYVI